MEITGSYTAKLWKHMERPEIKIEIYVNLLSTYYFSYDLMTSKFIIQNHWAHGLCPLSGVINN
jgi:hypothetical protein